MPIKDNGLVQQTQQTRTEIVDPIELIRYINGTEKLKIKKEKKKTLILLKRAKNQGTNDYKTVQKQ